MSTSLIYCRNCDPDMQLNFLQSTLQQQQQGIWSSINNTAVCPGKCCNSADVECRKRMDATGYGIMADDEYMLIFGGISARNKTYFDTLKNNYQSVYDNCEAYVAQVTAAGGVIDDTLKACGEELQNDLWKYSLRRNQWYQIKLDYNKETQQSIQVPSARMGHAGVYA